MTRRIDITETGRINGAEARQIEIPELSLILLVGASGSGKSTFASRHFRPTEVLSSDRLRAWISDDENDQSATKDAFDSLKFIAERRLSRGKLVVIDATNVQPEARKSFIDLAKSQDVTVVAIVLDVPDEVCAARNTQRTDRQLPLAIVRRQNRDLRQSLATFEREVRRVHILAGESEIDAVSIVRRPLWSNSRDRSGPFDIIGDVHGCLAELEQLLSRLGWARSDGHYRHPKNRMIIFLGDLVDRGPDSPGCVELAMEMVEQGTALCVLGNHEARLLRKLRGKSVTLTHGLAETMLQLESRSAEQIDEIAGFIDGLVSHYVLDGGRLVVAHAGMKERYQGRASGRVREFALYGETTGETDEYGLPVRADWAREYRGQSAVVYGHTPVVQAEWVNNTICIDTACVFGGKLSALRWPERELVQVDSARVYCEPTRPLGSEQDTIRAQHRADAILDLSDYLFRLRVETRYAGTVLVPETQAHAALEFASRFLVDPRWLVYLPPTISPSDTSQHPDWLEHPGEAFAYYQRHGVESVVCEEKHNGSRMIIVLARDEAAAQRRFGIASGSSDERGVCLSRTGRRFFGALRDFERVVLDSTDRAMTRTGLWDELGSDWVVLDTELMPWSNGVDDRDHQRRSLIGSIAAAVLSDTGAALQKAAAIGQDVSALSERIRSRGASVERYVHTYQRLDSPVRSADELRCALFHLMASEGAVHVDKDHLWHLRMAQRFVDSGEALFVPTEHLVVRVSDAQSIGSAGEWWRQLIERGTDGVVVKPRDFMVRGERGWLQPAIKCRSPEALRLMDGLDLVDRSSALRRRPLGKKRTLALSETALGIEALERFVRREPLRRIHECILAILALETEAVDPRL